MSLHDVAAEVARARAQLARVRSSSAGWNDAARHAFDSQHLDALDTAAQQATAALERADQDIAKAVRSLAE